MEPTRATTNRDDLARSDLRGARVTFAVFAALALAAAVCLYVADPAKARFYPPCIFHRLTGLYCPGCGSLRAASRLLHADLAGALSLNALFVLATPYMLWALVSGAREAATGRPLPAIALSKRVRVVLLVLVALFWILRNVPSAPFEALAP